MNRSERRAREKKIKGGCGISISRRLTQQDPYGQMLNQYSKIGEGERIKKKLRSKQVPGF